jgi:hypothetical protein
MEGMMLKGRMRKMSTQDLRRAACYVFVAILVWGGASCRAQLPTVAQCPTSNHDRVVAYKVLAELAYHQAQIGKYDIASRAAENLEFTWDHTYACLQTLGVSHNEQMKIDGMMDAFIIPVAALKKSGDKSAELTNITAAYLRYVKELDGL